MSLNETVPALSQKKYQLFSQDLPRFALRATLAGAYLTISTAFAALAGHQVQQLAPGLGGLVFALFFGLGLYAIVILNTDLATSNMMLTVYSAVAGKLSWARGIALVLVTTLCNLLGAVLMSLLLAQSAKLSGLGPDHLILTLTEGKLAKSPAGVFWEGVGANLVVNMAVLGALAAKDLISKFVTIVPIIAIFVGLGLEHVIANFALMTTAFFGATQLPDSMTLGAVAANWVWAFAGNYVGGGLLMGGAYAWLNKTPTSYRD